VAVATPPPVRVALYENTIGEGNTAYGGSALLSNVNGSHNTGVGLQVFYYHTGGSNNIALGFQAGINITAGSNNIEIGNGGGGATENNTIRIGTSGTHTATLSLALPGRRLSGTPLWWMEMVNLAPSLRPRGSRRKSNQWKRRAKQSWPLSQ
jgi:hypothetical protein